MKPTYYKGFTISVSDKCDMKCITIANPHTGQSHDITIRPANYDDYYSINFAKEYVDVVLLNNNG